MNIVVCVIGGSAEPLRLTVPAGVAVREQLDAPAGYDVVLMSAGTAVPEDWLERLLAVARDDPTVATASAACAGADGIPDVAPEELPGADAAFRSSSERLRPAICAPRSPLVLARARAIALAGPLDDGFGARATALGFKHVLADDLLVAGPPPHGPAGTAAARAVRAATRSLRPLCVTIDARSLGPHTAGTQVHAFELTAALARTGRATIRAVVPPDLREDVAAAFAGLGVETLWYEDAVRRATPPGDIVHRPSQVSTIDDLRLLLPLGDRLIVTQQDLLTYRIPDYHAEREHWLRHRKATRESLGAADHVVFFSEHVRAEAVAEDLVEPARASVIPIGTDRREPPEARPPGGVDASAPFLLCLGADLRHKNRRFALELLAALRRLGWDGRLVLAGPQAPDGSSRVDEDDWLTAHPDMPVTRLGGVSESERAWLLRSTVAVVYPSVTEGFGLLPFEAGQAGVPCLFASQTALAEILPGDLAVLVAWDAEASAERALPLLADSKERSRHIAGLAATAERYRWDDCAVALIDLYEAAVAAPAAPAALAARRERALEQRLAETEELLRANHARFTAIMDAVGDVGMALVGPDGLLDETDRRALAAVFKRRLLATPLRAVLRTAHAGGVRFGRYRR